METHVLLFLVAILAGAANAIAGGGGLLTFPVLMTVVTPVVADATSAVALLPAYATSTWAGRKHLGPVRRWFWLLLGPCLLGGLLGALLLNWSGDRSFVELIPWLILMATLLTLRPLLTRRNEPQPSGAAVHTAAPTPSIAFQIIAGGILFLVAIYGGYFGAGIGILVIGAFGLIGLTNIHAILPLKNALSGGLRAIAVAVFLVEGEVDWGYGLFMALGSLLGGYLGGRIAAHLTNRTLVRVGVVVLGLGMAGYYFWTLYGGGIHRDLGRVVRLLPD